MILIQLFGVTKPKQTGTFIPPIGGGVWAERSFTHFTQSSRSPPLLVWYPAIPPGENEKKKVYYLYVMSDVLIWCIFKAADFITVVFFLLSTTHFCNSQLLSVNLNLIILSAQLIACLLHSHPYCKSCLASYYAAAFGNRSHSAIWFFLHLLSNVEWTSL